MNTDANHSSHSKDSPAFVPLQGSERGPEPGPAATPGLRVSAPDDQEIEISIYLRRRRPVPEQHLPGGPPDGDPGTGHGADPADIELATRTLSALGARIIHADPQTRCLRVGGTTGTLAAIFGTRVEILQGNAAAPAACPSLRSWMESSPRCSDSMTGPRPVPGFISPRQPPKAPVTPRSTWPAFTTSPQEPTATER